MTEKCHDGYHGLLVFLKLMNLQSTSQAESKIKIWTRFEQSGFTYFLLILPIFFSKPIQINAKN